jgi:hypothetical protein
MQYTVLHSPGGGMPSTCYGEFNSREDAQAYIDLIKQPARERRGSKDRRPEWAGTFSIIPAQGNVIRPA